MTHFLSRLTRRLGGDPALIRTQIRTLLCRASLHDYTTWRPLWTECHADTVIERSVRHCRHCQHVAERSTALPRLYGAASVNKAREVGTELPRRPGARVGGPGAHIGSPA